VIKEEKQRAQVSSGKFRYETLQFEQVPKKQSAESHSGNDASIKKAVRPAIDDDTRFDVVIMGPDEDPIQFKLRGKNSVRKVLTAACKNFHINPHR